MTDKIKDFLQYVGFEKLYNYNGTCGKCNAMIHEDFLIAVPPPINMQDGNRMHYLWFPIQCPTCGAYIQSITVIAYNVSAEFDWLNKK